MKDVIDSRKKADRWPLVKILTPSRCALLVIDVQNDFCAPGGYFDRHGFDIDPCRLILPSLSVALHAAKAAGVLTVFVQYTQLINGLSISEPHLRALYHDPVEPFYCIKDTWGHNIEASLPKSEEQVQILKYRASAFYQTSLDLLLKINGVQTCVVSGLVTEGCVEATARAAVMHDYFTVLLTDAVASFDQDLHTAALKVLSATVDCVSTNAVREIWGSLN